MNPITDTIVWGSFDARAAAAAGKRWCAGETEAEAELDNPAEAGSGLFKIRAADSTGRRSSADILIKRRYAWRGYEVGALPDQQTAQRVTLSAIDNGRTIGTITVGLDGDSGINADDEFGEEIDALRGDGWRVCEFTRLAVDNSIRSKRVLASLFHVAYIYAHRIQRADMLVMEVNPRHVRYYMAMLGCRVLGEERVNHRVNAPAVLLCLEFEHIRTQIARFGGHTGEFVAERTLYPHAFSSAEEVRIIERLGQSAWMADASRARTRLMMA